MTRYATGTKLDYQPLDRRAIVDHKLTNLAAPPKPEIVDVVYRLVRACRTEYSTISYAQEITSYLRWCAGEGIDPFEATEDEAHAYAAWIGRYAQGTQNLKLRIARIFYDRAMGEKLVAANPFARLDFPKRIPETDTPALTKTQVEQLLCAISAEFGQPDTGLTAKRDYAMVTLMVRLCLRTMECCSLRWGRFHEADGRMRISFLGKGLKPAHLVVPHDVWSILQNWRRAYEKATGVTMGPADPVFVSLSPGALRTAKDRRGSSPLDPMYRRSVYAVVRARFTDIGIVGPRYSPHCLRATGAVLAFRAGATIIQCQALLRHSSVETTMRYLQTLVGGAATQAIDKIQLDVPIWHDDDDRE